MDPVSKNRATEISEKYPNLRPWPKGVSGNPGGRPKKPRITEIYEEIYDDPEFRKAIKKQMLQTMTSAGMAGVLERREAADRLEGRVVQPMEMNVNVTLSERLERAKERLSLVERTDTGTDS